MDEQLLAPDDPLSYAPLIGPERTQAFSQTLEQARSRLEGRTVWHINSTAQGGGVAEMLQTVLPYQLGAGIRTRWIVVEGNEDFFELTRKLHVMLHGKTFEATDLGDEDRALYERTLAPEVDELLDAVQAGDPVVLHDPQTLGLAPALRARGAHLIWTSHIGSDSPDVAARAAWSFLAPYVAATEAQVFSRAAHRWVGLDERSTAIIPPCIDAWSPKNIDMSQDTARKVLQAIGVLEPQGEDPAADLPTELRRHADMVTESRVPADAPIVCQVSRWDPLKDHIGVMHGFGLLPNEDAHLVLAGPSPDAIPDDPTGGEILEEVLESWRQLPDAVRSRVHICCLPMADLTENALMVNALQRTASVVLQKSLAEGFGLTVAEAMWKFRPVVGSRVGGIQDQIVHQRTGLLVDPVDQRSVAAATARLLRDRAFASRCGESARARVCEEYLPPHYIARYLTLITSLVSRHMA